jgi:hypothetical protein
MERYNFDTNQMTIDTHRMRSIVFRAGIAGWLAASMTLAQFPIPPAGQGQQGPPQTVRGVVVNAVTSEPIPRALVTLWSSIQRTTFSDNSGRFEFENVPAGRVSIRGQRPGFSDMQSRRAMVQINLTAQTGDVRIELEPTSRIEGRILNEEGEPLHGITVQVLASKIFNGRKRWMNQGGGATTDSSGQFTIEDLASGQYTLHTSPRALFPGLQASMRGRQVASNIPVVEGYPPRYFPEAVDLASAQILDLKPGQEIKADMTLKAKPTYRVTGTVSGATGRTYLTVQDTAGQPASTGAQVDPQTGRFTIPAMFEGAWTLSFQSIETSTTPGLHAKETVQISHSDITNLNVQMQPSVSIPVEVDAPATGTVNAASPPAAAVPKNPPVQLSLIPSEPGSFMQLTARRRNPDDSLSLYGVPAGSYRIAVQVTSGVCIGSVVSGSSDLLTSELTVSEGAAPAPIQVTLRSDCAKLSGKVNTAPSSATATLVAISDVPGLMPAFAQIRADGTFQTQELSPGDYHVYAVPTIEGLEYGNPDVLRALRGQAIHLEANQMGNVTLDLNTPGESER